jgi:estrogen-related receptor beta like 1
VTTESVVEEVEANDEEDEMFGNQFHASKKEEVVEQSVVKCDPAEWRLEVERVTPLLKLKLSNDNKDWRLHLQQMEFHQEKITSNMTETQNQLHKLHQEIEQTLEKIASREKYINAQFESQTEEYKRLLEQASDTKQKHSVASSSVSELSNELTRISEELDQVKARMDELGNGMTDSKPLLAIKQGATRLKV